MNVAESWYVRLLGAQELTRGSDRIDRFPSRAVATLLARLALAPGRMHPREELVELLWPGVELAVGRNRLRQALSTLKRLLEAPGAPPVLLADRLGIRVAAGALRCDVRDFEEHLRVGRLVDATACWRGELLPGRYDAWIADERLRLAALADRRQALALWEALGNAHAVNGGIYNLAVCARNARRWTEALLRLEAVCANARDADDRQQLASALNLRGEVLAALRDWPRAGATYRECIAVAWAAAEPLALAYGLWNAPRVLAHLRRPRDAGRLMGFIAGHWSRHFGALTDSDRADLRRVRRLVAVQVGADAAAAAFGEGAGLTLADAVALAGD